MKSQAPQGVASPVASQIGRRSVMLGAGFALTAGLAAAMTPRRHEASIGGARLEALAPTSAGPWRSVPGGSLIVPDADQPISFYDQVLTRTYVAADQPSVMLLIAYGAAQSGMMKVHRPEVCYASAGFSIRGFAHTDVPLGGSASVPAADFLAVREDRSEQVLYWTRVSDTFPRDLATQRLVVFERGLGGVVPDGVLVRFSTVDPDLAAGRVAMVRFADALVAAAGPKGRALLVGGLRSTVRA